MADEPPVGLTVLGRCGLREAWLRLVSDQAKPGDWESLPRREPRRARDRQQGLAPWRPKLIEAKPNNKPESEQSATSEGEITT
jgi:hypothetical protein